MEVESGPRVDAVGRGRRGQRADGVGRAYRSRLGLAAGQYYRKADVDRKLEQLVADLREQGYYEARADHQLRPGAQPGSAELAINVDGGARITVVFEGDPLSQKERRELVPIEREGSVDEDLLEDSVNRIESHLRAQGYRDADAEYERTPRDGGLAVVFKVRRGPQFRTARVTMTGATAVPEADLRALLRTREGELFVEAAVESDAATLAEQYRRPRVHTGSSRAGLGARGRQRSRRCPSTSGSPLPKARERPSAPSPSPARTPSTRRRCARRSPRGPVSPTTSSRSRSTATACCWCCSIAGTLRPPSTPAWSSPQDRSSAAVAFVVAEGPQVFVEHVLVVGNVKTSAEMIRREVTLQPGAPLSYAELTESQRRISALGLFRRVRITELDHGEPNRRDLLVTVEEAPATTVGYGGGVEGGQRLRQDRTRRRRHRGVRGRAARVCRVRPAKPLRPQSVHQRVCARQPAHQGVHDQRGRRRGGAERLHTARLPPARDLSRAALPRHIQRPARHRVSSSRGCDPASTSPGAGHGRS